MAGTDEFSRLAHTCGEAGLQPDHGGHPGAHGFVGDALSLVGVNAQRPFTEHHLPGRQRLAHQLMVVSDLDRYHHQIHQRVFDQRPRVVETIHPELCSGTLGRSRAPGGYGAQPVTRQRL